MTRGTDLREPCELCCVRGGGDWRSNRFSQRCEGSRSRRANQKPQLLYRVQLVFEPIDRHRKERYFIGGPPVARARTNGQPTLNITSIPPDRRATDVRLRSDCT
jgi:hypothetical protein